MATDGSGGLWIAASYPLSNAFTIARYVLRGDTWTSSTPCGNFGDTSGMAYGPDGDLYVSAFVTSPFIAKFAPTCLPYKFNTSGALAIFNIPVLGSMAFGADGALWIADGPAGAIGHLTTSGQYSEFRVPFVGSHPLDITKGSDGAMWFTDFGTNAIGRVTMTGTFLEFPVPTRNAFGGGGIVACPRTCEHAHERLWFTENNAIGEIVY